MEKEVRVYIVETFNGDIEEKNDVNKLTDDEFIELAEEQGTTYSLKDFQNIWNHYSYAMVNTEYSCIRFIEVETQK